MFRAAADVGRATRPLLTFYGLNQAGRAIAAAASSVSGDDWRLSGHGISARNLQDSLPDVAIHRDKAGSKGSFVRLSEILGSALWDGPVPLRRLWDAIPDERLNPLADDDSRRTPLFVETVGIYGEPHSLASVEVCYFAPWVIDSQDGRTALVTYLSAFPDAQGYHSYFHSGPEPGDPEFTRHVNGWGELPMNWQVEGDGSPRSADERLAFIRSIATEYAGSLHFFPVVGNSTQSIHPLMAWWAVLHCLSMLARYQPAEWSQHIDVDHSRFAVPLESLLRDALTVVPVIIAETIERVA
jgi:hypothetical protein